jgi:hypothetical protein
MEQNHIPLFPFNRAVFGMTEAYLSCMNKIFAATNESDT